MLVGCLRLRSSVLPRLKVLTYNFALLALVVFVIVQTVEAVAPSSPSSSATSFRSSPASAASASPDSPTRPTNIRAMASNLRGGSTGAALRGATAPIPRLLYGTAWKKDRTQELVELAVRTGFRGIDTACQPKHYFERGVGAALERLIADGVVKREDLFLQTKYTPIGGQDPNDVPYDRTAPLPDQVAQSVAKSLDNLKTTYLDSLVLHSPLSSAEKTMEVWRAMEAAHTRHQALRLGISNIYDLDLLKTLYNGAVVKPSFVQNRFYKDSGYDRDIRKFLKENGVTYQSFWTLTANPQALQSRTVRDIAAKYGKTEAQVFFAFMHAQGVLPLTGTKDVVHMQQDLEAHAVPLTADDVAAIDALLR